MMGLQSKGSGGGKQQPHQLHIGGGGLGPEQLHAALQLFMQPLGAAFSRGAAEGAAHGPEPQGAGPPGQAGAGGAGGVGGATNGAALQQININLASVVELEQLPGVGPATAKAIVAYREKFGAFLKVEDLLKVRGIGPAKLSEILPRARVS